MCCELNSQFNFLTKSHEHFQLITEVTVKMRLYCTMVLNIFLSFKFKCYIIKMYNAIKRASVSHWKVIQNAFDVCIYSVRRWNTSHCIISLCQVPYGLDEGLNPANIRSQDDRWIHLAMPHLQGASSCTPIGSFHCGLDIQHTYPLNLMLCSMDRIWSLISEQRI